MTELHKSEAFSLLQTNASHGIVPPHQAALSFFRDLRPNLERQPWNLERNWIDADQDFRRQEMDVDHPTFTGTIDWLVDGPPKLLFDSEPASGRLEEALFVHSPKWRTQAEIKLTRNALRYSVIDLDAGISRPPVVADRLFVDIKLEANAPNERDRLRTSFNASDWHLDGYRSDMSRIVNGAPKLSGQLDAEDNAAIEVYQENVRDEHFSEPQLEDIDALRESIELMRKALAYLRQT